MILQGPDLLYNHDNNGQKVCIYPAECSDSALHNAVSCLLTSKELAEFASVLLCFLS